MRKIIVIFATVLCVFLTLPACAGADTGSSAAAEGKCGDDLSFSYDKKTKTLMISGTGDMYETGHLFRDYEIKTLILEEGMTSIGRSAFYGHHELEGELTLPESLKKISEFAFYGCSGLTGDLVLPDGLESVENYTFRQCTGFDGALVIPDSVRSIGDEAFSECSGLTGSS